MDKQLDMALGSLGINEPYSIEAEQAILGAALISPETVSLIIEQVRAEYFYSRQNQKIYLEIHKLFNANIPSDFITVLNSVIANGVFTDEAEAKVYLNDLDGATHDFALWCQGYNVDNGMEILPDSSINLTKEKIQTFYSADANVNWVPVLHNLDMDPNWAISAEQMPFVHCALHFRRIETLHDGHRWQDIKRYGIEIEHVQGKDAPRKLVWNDDRRAIQLPQEVILSGMTANPREVLGDNLDNYSASSGHLDPNDVYSPSTIPVVSATSLPHGTFVKNTNE